jgi:hypothetical protein
MLVQSDPGCRFASANPVLVPHTARCPEAGGSQPYIYFPTDAIVSLLYVMETVLRR